MSETHAGEELGPQPTSERARPRPEAAEPRVAELMRAPPRPLLQLGAVSLGELLVRLRRAPLLPVVDDRGRLQGAVTRSSVLALGARPVHDGLPIRTLMTSPSVLLADSTVEQAARAFTRECLAALPVVDRGGHLVGILHDDAVLAAVLGEEPTSTPGGTPTVDDVMTRSPITVAADLTLEEAAPMMAEAGVRHLPVVDGEGRLIGVLSDRDMRESLGTDTREWYRSAETSLSETVGNVMSPDPIALVSGTSLTAAFEVFADEGVGAIPIVGEDERVVGILSYVDVLAWMSRARGAGKP